MRMSSAFRHSVGERISYSSCSGFHSTFLILPCLFSSGPMERFAIVAPKQQFPLVRWAVIVCSYNDIGTLGVCLLRATRRSRLIFPLPKIAGTLSRLAGSGSRGSS
jgi:hypothetical protein